MIKIWHAQQCCFQSHKNKRKNMKHCGIDNAYGGPRVVMGTNKFELALAVESILKE